MARLLALSTPDEQGLHEAVIIEGITPGPQDLSCYFGQIARLCEWEGEPLRLAWAVWWPLTEDPVVTDFFGQQVEIRKIRLV